MISTDVILRGNIFSFYCGRDSFDYIGYKLYGLDYGSAIGVFLDPYCDSYFAGVVLL